MMRMFGGLIAMSTHARLKRRGWGIVGFQAFMTNAALFGLFVIALLRLLSRLCLKAEMALPKEEEEVLIVGRSCARACVVVCEE